MENGQYQVIPLGSLKMSKTRFILPWAWINLPASTFMTLKANHGSQMSSLICCVHVTYLKMASKSSP